MKLKLAAGLSLPLDFATKTAAILAQRRKGKTYTASVIAEEMVAAKQPFVALDPTGAWWGLRAAADGKSDGLPVVVLGGQHGDVPLERTGGRLIADLVVEEPGYYVIDFSLFESGEAERQFAVDFAERLYRAKGQAGKDFPLHLFVDEADRFIPQQMRKGSGETSPRLLGAFEAIVRRGGLRGLGTTLISQRAAVVNKNVLEMLDVLIVLRTVGPNDQQAILNYIKAHGTDAERVEMMGSLASLDIGEAWVWEPGAEPPLFQRVRVRQRHTFNSSATPKHGEKRVEPKRLADVDLAALQTRMAATIEKAKAEDPRELRKTIAELKKELAASNSRKPSVAKSDSIRRVEVLTEADRALLAKLLDGVEGLRAGDTNVDVGDLADDLAVEISKAVDHVFASKLRIILKAIEAKGFQKILAKLQAVQLPDWSPANKLPPRHVLETIARASGRRLVDSRATRPVSTNGASSEGITPAKQKILNGLAFLRGIGVPAADKTQLALLVGVSPSSGGFFNSLGALRSAGLITYPSGGIAALTEAGAGMASTNGVPTTTGELHDAIRAKLPPAKWKILDALIEAYPKAIRKDDLAAQIAVSPTSGGFFNNLGSLRSLGLVDYPQPGTVAAQPVLFLE